MQTKSIFSIFAGLLLGACLAVPALTTLAQNNAPQRTDRQADINRGPVQPNPNIVYLKCEPSKSDVSALVKVTNNTSQALPQGTMIVAKNQKGLQSNYTVGSGGLKPNANVIVTLGGSWTDSTPCSAYAKK